MRFIQGKGNYVDDVQLPDMVYGHVVRSPYAHARLKGINTVEAMKLPGVLAVITGEDLAKEAVRLCIQGIALSILPSPRIVINRCTWSGMTTCIMLDLILLYFYLWRMDRI